MIALDILTDGFFAAVAGIGFGAISDPPLRAYWQHWDMLVVFV